jgi:hypothetical protein
MRLESRWRGFTIWQTLANRFNAKAAGLFGVRARRTDPYERSMTVLIYVDTIKQVGHPDHLKVFANADAAEAWFAENDPKARRSNTRWPLV